MKHFFDLRVLVVQSLEKLAAWAVKTGLLQFFDLVFVCDLLPGELHVEEF